MTARCPIGSLLSDRYCLVRLLAVGGMATVYEASDTVTGERVAVKLSRTGPGHARAQHALQREYLLASNVSHPHICRVHHLVQHDRDTWFMTMELLAGVTLANRLKTGGRLSTVEALPHGTALAEALEAAHRAGVVHRDLKSSNIMLVPEGCSHRAVITDFGVAATTTAEPVADESGSPGRSGTLAYMAPEQLRGERPRPTADIYALGVVLFEAVTGVLPFAGGAAAWQRLDRAPPSPRAHVPDLDRRWDQVILRCLARAPRDRFAHAAEVADALRQSVVPGSISLGVDATRDPLPVEREPLYGREPALAQLGALLEGDARLVTLQGPAGIGKTRLATRYAWATSDRWPGRVWFCDLSDARDESALLFTMATTLDIPLTSTGAVSVLGRALAALGKAVVVLDNFEQLTAVGDEALQAWLAAAPDVRFIATSRTALGLDGEVTLPLAGLDEDAGTRLFLERAHSQRAELSLDRHEERAVRDLVSLLRGVPLAIEVAATRAARLQPSVILEQLTARSLTTDGAFDSLSATLDAVWEQLSADERSTLTQASVFEGGFTLEAAQSVIDVGDAEAPVVHVLRALVARRLLRMWVAAGEPRFGMYVGIHEYARDKLALNEAVERGAEHRHGQFFATYGDPEHFDALGRSGRGEGYASLVCDRDNLWMATRLAVLRADARLAAQCLEALASDHDRGGPYRHFLALGQDVLQLATESDHETRARAARTVGRALLRAGRFAEAQTRLEQALHSARACAGVAIECDVLRLLAAVDLTTGQFDRARARLTNALERSQTQPEGPLRPAILSMLAVVHGHRSRPEEALALYESALALARSAGDAPSASLIHGNLGAFLLELGRLDQAEEHLEQALTASAQMSSRPREASAHDRLGVLHLARGTVAKAASHFERALALWRELGNASREATALYNLAHLKTDLGRHREALDLGERALRLSRDAGLTRMEGATLGTLAVIAARLGDIDEARAMSAAGEEILRPIDCQLDLAKLLTERAHIELLAGDRPAADRALAAASAIADDLRVGPDSPLASAIADAREALHRPSDHRPSDPAPTRTS